MRALDVSKILWEVWDPLDLRVWANVPDEYDDYVPKILELLKANISEPELASALNVIFRESIGVGVLASPIRRSVRAAQALILLRDG